MELSDYRTYVQERLIISTGEAATETQIDLAVNAERDRLNAYFRLLRATDTLDFVADTETVTIPSDVVEILAIKRGEYLMQPVNEQTLAGYQAAVFGDTGVLGGPIVYDREGTAATIRVFPTPTETETDAATIRYVQRPAILTADDDAPDELPREFHDLIGELVVYRFCLAEEDPELANASHRVIYGNPGVPDDLGLMGRLAAYMNRTAGPTVNQIQLGGRRR
jgi:hypothetical protein